MKNAPASAPEFSRVFPVDKLRDHPVMEKIEAEEKERAALTKRLNLADLKKLTANMQLQRVTAGDMVEVSGTVNARVVQNCVVTLEPFETDIEEGFKAYFARKPTKHEETDLPVEDEKAPETIPANGEIDLGELAAQHLSLALDPYPRKPGAEFKLGNEGAGEPEGKPNPFAVLADYRGGKSPKKK
jgi:uncharacterized metal-binding protein YceD (DUF177 family)